MVAHKSERDIEAETTDHVEEQPLDAPCDIEFGRSSTTRKSVCLDVSNPILQVRIDGRFNPFDIFALVLQRMNISMMHALNLVYSPRQPSGNVEHYACVCFFP